MKYCFLAFTLCDTVVNLSVAILQHPHDGEGLAWFCAAIFTLCAALNEVERLLRVGRAP